MNGKRITLFVEGMTCSSCESRISSGLRVLDGMIDVKARLQGGIVQIEYDESVLDLSVIKAAIEKMGYPVRSTRGAGTFMALGIGLVLVAGYGIALSSGLFNNLPKVDATLGYGMLFVVGLLTSIHCVAMCGGVALSQSIGQTESQSTHSSKFEKLSPGFFYNAGRVLSYTIVGGIVGGVGSIFSFSPLVKAGIAGLAGIFMVILGLKMLGVLRGIPKFTARFPARIRSAGTRLALALQNRGPFAVGILNGLMPCGPLQTMQLYALGTGSAIAGAFSMFVFSAGTVPLMLVFGVTATLLPRKFLPAMVRASAVLVMFLGVMTVTRAASLAGIPLTEIGALSPGNDRALPVVEVADRGGRQSGTLKATLAGGVQTVLTEFKNGYYVPFVVQVGIPVRWTIRVTADELNGCNNPVTVPSYGITKKLVPGDNIVEFTPKKVGLIGYTCWMGMISSSISVVNDVGLSDSATIQGSSQPDSQTAVQGSCCSGVSSPDFADGKVPVDTIGIPVLRNGVQEVTVTVDGRGYSPAVIVLQRGVKAIIKFDAAALTSCNNVVVFPEYSGSLDLTKGQLETPEFQVVADFTFQCWMGMIHGYAKTVDDIATVDIPSIKAELANYRASGGGGCCGGGSSGGN